MVVTPYPLVKPMTVLRITALVLFICLLLPPAFSVAAEPQNTYSAQILQYVEQDKVYLLENLRSRVTKNSEKTVITALLTEDGPEAARLFSKQLIDFPDASLDSLSKARLTAYQQSINVAGENKRTVTQPAFILQFGSFNSLDNARELANRIASYTPVTIFQEKGQHKVRTQNSFNTRKTAEAKAKALPFNSLIVHLK